MGECFKTTVRKDYTRISWCFEDMGEDTILPTEMLLELLKAWIKAKKEEKKEDEKENNK